MQQQTLLTTALPMEQDTSGDDAINHFLFSSCEVGISIMQANRQQGKTAEG